MAPISKPTVGQPGWNTAVDAAIDKVNAHDQNPLVTATVTTTGAAVDRVPAVTDVSPLTFGLVDRVTTAERLGLRDRRTRLARLERGSVGASSTRNLVTLTGEGTVTHLFIALAGTGLPLMFDGRLQITADGAGTPDIDMDLGTLFVTHNQQNAASATGQIGCDLMQAETGNTGLYAGYNLHLDIPYRNGLVINLVNGNATATGTVFCEAFYDTAPPAPVVLKSGGRRYANKAVLASTDTHTMLDLPAGTSGWLVWNTICGKATTTASSMAWLERDIEVSVDGEASPSIASTGMEDWFFGSFYYMSREYQSAPWYVVGVNRLGYCSQGVDLRKVHGGIRFTNGIQVVMGTEAEATTGHEMAYCFLYYQDIP